MSYWRIEAGGMVVVAEHEGARLPLFPLFSDRLPPELAPDRPYTLSRYYIPAFETRPTSFSVGMEVAGSIRIRLGEKIYQNVKNDPDSGPKESRGLDFVSALNRL